MPRYYFDITDSRGFHRDEVGDNFDGFDEARDQCQGLLTDEISEELSYAEELAMSRLGDVTAGLDDALIQIERFAEED